VVPDRITRETVIDAPPERVWAVLTEPGQVAQWFSDEVEMDVRPGGRLVFTWHEEGVLAGRVERVEPPHRLTFRWTRDGELREDNSTLVEITLTGESDGGTRLRVEETGFQSLAVPEDDQARFVDENFAGWDRELGDLREYVARQSVGDP